MLAGLATVAALQLKIEHVLLPLVCQGVTFTPGGSCLYEAVEG